jgi:curved DNA-binding protein CbpA
MASPYTILGVPHDADDSLIRARYLECVREYPPEQYPERFACIRKAYESIATAEDRAYHRLFESHNDETIEDILREISCRKKTARPSLNKLIEVSRYRPASHKH